LLEDSWVYKEKDFSYIKGFEPKMKIRDGGSWKCVIDIRLENVLHRLFSVINKPTTATPKGNVLIDLPIKF